MSLKAWQILVCPASLTDVSTALVREAEPLDRKPPLTLATEAFALVGEGVVAVGNQWALTRELNPGSLYC